MECKGKIKVKVEDKDELGVEDEDWPDSWP